MSHGVPRTIPIIIMGITCCLKTPQFLTLGTHVDITLKNMYILHVNNLEVTGKSPQVLQKYVLAVAAKFFYEINF